MKRTHKPVVIMGAAVAALALLSGCSSSDASMPQDSGNEGADMEAGQDPAMLALCDQMIADGLTSAEATALAEENGYTARVGTIDGEPQQRAVARPSWWLPAPCRSTACLQRAAGSTSSP